MAVSIIAWLGFTGGSLAAPPQIDSVTAQAMTTCFNQGMAAYEKADWSKAVTEMEKVISICEKYPDPVAAADAKLRLGPVYYVIGAAQFNVPEYTKSIAAFTTFMKLFPKDERVPQARLAVARATYLNGEFAKAAKLFEELERYPSLREQSLVIQAECLKESGKIPEMVTVVEKLIADGITTTPRAGAALMLAQARSAAGEYVKLASLLEQLIPRRHLIENIVELNSLIVALGDAQMGKDQFEKASRTYLNVLPPAQVIAFQKQRVDTLTKRIAANKLVAENSPQSKLSILGQNAALQTVLDQAKELLTDFEKLPDYMPGMMLRNARCWYGRDKKWEAILVNERLIQRYPNAKKEKEAALYYNAICYADVMQVKTCQQVCEQYLIEFPKGENAGVVAYVQGAVALQAGDLKGAATVFEKMVALYPNNTYIHEMYLLLGSSHFSLGELDEAKSTYQNYIGKFPTGASAEEAHYRAAVIPVFQGKYEEGWKTLEAFLKSYPNSPFASEAEYRLMVCKYAANLYDEVLADMEKWQRKHSGSGMESEMYSLKGDCLAALLKNKEAADAYRTAAKCATGDEVLNYALNQASKLLQKTGDMAQLSQMWEEFITQRPDHFSVVVGIYWISKAKTREGKTDEAKAITVTQLKRSLNQYKNESVEMLLQNLAQLCWKRPRVPLPPPVEEPLPVLDKDGKPVPRPEPPAPPPLPPWDAMAELEKQIQPLTAIADDGGRQRLNYVRMEMFKILKMPEEADKLMGKIAESKPEILSPQLLALSGDYLQSKKRDAEAIVHYNFLKNNFLKSAWLDYPYSGLAAIELAKGNTQKAVELYTLAANEYAGAKVKDSTLGLAMALLESKRYPEAGKLFEQVASTREWRGESTGQAVYYLGVVEEQQNKLPEAIAYYQRVFVGYQKYATWVEKAYISAALCFDKLNKRDEAIAHLQELRRNDKLGLDAKLKARELLLKWGVQL